MEVTTMSEKSRLALGLLVLALALGLIGDALFFRAASLGLNVAAWVFALLAAIVLVARRYHITLTGSGRWLALPAAGFALAFAWRDSPALATANLVALLTCLALVASHSRAGRIGLAGIGEYTLSGMRLTWAFLTGLLALWIEDLGLADLPRGRWSRQALAVVRGAAIAAPLLLIFGGLFASADAVFSSAVASLFRWDLSQVAQHLIWVTFWAMVAGGVLRESLLVAATGGAPSRPGVGPSMGVTEMVTALGALDLLFLAFVLVQLRYLFGGAALVEASMDLTYAEYARRGFFELVAVVALTLPLLLAADWLRPRGGRAHDRLFGVLAGSLVAMLFVVTASATQRMMLYQEEFGLTELRLYTTAFMGWLSAVLAWFVATVLRGRRERFASGAMVAGLAMVALLNLLNPDALIVATNVERARAGESFDSVYVTSLSADAVPRIVRALPSLPEESRQEVAQRLAELWSLPPSPDLRTWNWARLAAWEAVSGSGMEVSR